jgi:anaerobic selenocysteine-containing dehydrogenase
MRVRGLSETAAGLPTAALPDEMLLEGDGQIRALISCSGNPVGAWPNQEKVVRALRGLDLLVQIDPWLSQTAKLADYVIAPKLPLETPGTTQLLDFTSLHVAGYGLVESYSQYTPAIVETPEGSDLIEEWEFFYGIAQRLGLNLELARGVGFMRVATQGATSLIPVDMANKPTTDEVIELLTANSRVPLDEVKKYPHGQLFPEPAVRVGPKEPGWAHRLDVGNVEMMEKLDALAGPEPVPHSDLYPFRLVCRRSREMYNSTVNDGISTKGRRHNLAYLNPEDLEALQLEDGDLVTIRSRIGTILGMVAPDASLRPGLVSMNHSYGNVDATRTREDYLEFGSNVAALVDDEEEFDSFSGQPLMSNVPVAVTRA